MRNYLLKICYLFVWIVIFCSNAYPEGNKKESGSKLNKPDAQTAFSYLNINNISSYFYNNGISDVSPSGNSGFVYPKGSGKTAVFTSGLLWGAKVSGFTDPRVGGTAYRTGLVPGKVLPNGTADNPALDKYRIYRVRRDIYPGGPSKDLITEAVNEGTDAASLRTAYETDWTQWPAEMGAPFEDKDGNGIYNPDKDIPGFPGADQTLWYVTNDLNSGQTTFLYGSNPLEIECQVTIWAYNRTGALGNMYFRKYKLINITNRTDTPVTFDEMYVSMWSDVDLGDAGDDFIGVDTVLSLQYSYNAAANDNVYNPLPPPAVGFDFFQGPLINGIAGQDKNKNGVDDASDYGIFNNQKVGPGKINLPMTAAYYFANGDPNLGDPPQGNIGDGSRQFYNFFQGKYGISGTPFINLVTGEQTSFALSGDPVKGTGWIDGVQLPAGDRRQGSASGPFNMAPGDTQEVVVAEIIAGAVPGIDRLSAITLLKVYDQQAQKAYDSFFDLPQAPPAPVVKTTQLDKEIILNWANDEANYLATENSNSKGYKFQGYNVYQLPTSFSTVSEGRRIATFDIVDKKGTIIDLVFDPISGSVVMLPVQFGNDYGVKRFISIKNDFIKGSPLVNGTKYYYAVTAYNYNPDPMAVPNNIENPINVIMVIPQTPDTGDGHGGKTGQFLQMTHVGAADGNPNATIVDPGAILGHDYEVYFSTRQEIRNQNGDWVAGSKVSRKFSVNHPDTLTGSTIDAAAVHGSSGDPEVELRFILNLVSVDYDYADGVKIVFPTGTTIVSAPKFEAGNGTITPTISDNIVVFGETNHLYSTNGLFTGKEEMVVIVSALPLPSTIAWTIYDDAYGGGPVDVSGTSTITSIGTRKRTAKYWNVKDATTNVIKLENQGTFVDKTDPTGFTTINYFPKRDDIPVKSTTSADPVVDGFQIGVDGSFDAPINFNKDKLALTRGPGSTSTLIQTPVASTSSISIVNYTIFAGTISSKAIDNFGFGRNVLEELQQDYELRFTGVWDTTILNGQMIIKVKDGTGSLATIFSGLNSNSIKNHPLNPNPGSSDPFLIRIPFEVWNKETKKQVNLIFRDRVQEATVSPFYAWNPKNRMYGIIVNSDYNETTPITGALKDAATWVLVFYGTNYHVGDVVSVYYDNPFVIGTDRYTFSTDNLVGIAEGNSLSPNEYFLYQNFPNPFNPTTTIKYDIPKEGLVTIKIFDILGREVETLVNEEKPAGKYQITFNAKKLSSGIYFYSIKTGDYIKTLKSILLK
ncbi:MAG: T9SS type A sorting domain-containing protein [Ignavibacteria bacterium]|nr:T9SS type A sorting domain-containing protein [Ignavibacteria bacterium]